MNKTIIKKGNDFEVLNPHKAEAYQRIAERVGLKHRAEIKEILQENERRERIAQLMKEDALKKLEETPAERLNRYRENDKTTRAEFEKLYFGDWDHEDQSPAESWKHEISFNAAGKITGDRFSPSLNKIKRNPRTSQDAPGSTNAKDRDNATAKAIEGLKPRENRGPNSKKFL